VCGVKILALSGWWGHVSTKGVFDTGNVSQVYQVDPTSFSLNIRQLFLSTVVSGMDISPVKGAVFLTATEISGKRKYQRLSKETGKR